MLKNLKFFDFSIILFLFATHKLRHSVYPPSQSPMGDSSPLGRALFLASTVGGGGLHEAKAGEGYSTPTVTTVVLVAPKAVVLGSVCVFQTILPIP